MGCRVFVESESEMKSKTTGGAWECPMHPARLQAAAGACPDCGMALEPLVAAVWTCPMHPEVVARMPGSCPHCGMALESIDPAACCPLSGSGCRWSIRTGLPQ